MRITVKLFAGLKRFAPEGAGDEVTIDLADGATAQDAASALKIPQGHAGTAFVDGERAPFDLVLQDGQVVGLVPPLGGG